MLALLPSTLQAGVKSLLVVSATGEVQGSFKHASTPGAPFVATLVAVEKAGAGQAKDQEVVVETLSFRVTDFAIVIDTVEPDDRAVRQTPPPNALLPPAHPRAVHCLATRAWSSHAACADSGRCGPQHVVLCRLCTPPCGQKPLAHGET